MLWIHISTIHHIYFHWIYFHFLPQSFFLSAHFPSNYQFAKVLFMFLWFSSQQNSWRYLLSFAFFYLPSFFFLKTLQDINKTIIHFSSSKCFNRFILLDFKIFFIIFINFLPLFFNFTFKILKDINFFHLLFHALFKEFWKRKGRYLFKICFNFLLKMFLLAKL